MSAEYIHESEAAAYLRWLESKAFVVPESPEGPARVVLSVDVLTSGVAVSAMGCNCNSADVLDAAVRLAAECFAATRCQKGSA